MEEFDDDDFSDLYADVEVQASSAISALHRSTELPPRTDRISAQGQNNPPEELKNLSGDRCQSRSASWTASEDSDGVERKVDDDCAAEKSANAGDYSSQRKVVLYFSYFGRLYLFSCFLEA